MHSLLAYASFSCVAKNYFVCMHPWQHLPHLPYLTIIICWCFFCIPRNASLKSQSIVLSLLHFWRELMHSVFGTSFLFMCCNELLCFHAPMATPSILAWPNSHHLLVCFMYSKKCMTPKSEYCAVFAPLLEGVYAFFVGSSFLLMCCKDLHCFQAPMATTSTLA